MKRFVSVLIAVLGVIFLSAQPIANADANNFVFTSFEADYYLAQDTEKRSTLKVQETLIAQFPNFDQNHGIERAIPNVYDGHSVSLSISSVKKEDGTPWNYTTYASGGYTIVRIGDADRFVQGTQTYVIEYTMRDVTKAFENGNEFFWDTNGTEWSQSFSSVVARVHIDSAIVSRLDGRTACYSGSGGSTAQDCTVTTEEIADETVITTVATRPLAAGENISVVVGFEPSTFAPYQGFVVPPWAVFVGLVVIVLLYIALPIKLLFWGIGNWSKNGRDRAIQWTIVPQYSPPKDVSVIQSDVIIHEKMSPKAITATIIDLAIRHYIKIYEVGKKEYELELTQSTESLEMDDRSVTYLLFPGKQNVGDRVALKDMTSLYTRVETMGTEAYAAAISDGYMVDTRAMQKRMNSIGGGLLVLGVFTFNPLLCVAAVVVLIYTASMPARTEKGVEMKGYLDGTKMYMEVAESERIKLLQSPDTAETIDTGDTGQLVKLYERLLPLAMLYGIEKQWASQFASLYTQETQPDWYSGSKLAFNAGAFTSAVSSFGTVAQTSFSPPVSSSSSGFSGGGGSSGGGGGGGGGGGW